MTKHLHFFGLSTAYAPSVEFDIIWF